MQEKIIDKLKKIKALADRGDRGEATAARVLLKIQLKKYGLLLSDLEENNTTFRAFKYKTRHEKRLLIQILGSENLKASGVMNTITGRTHKKIGGEMTAMQYAEIQNKIDFYFDLWDKEKEKLMMAFYHHHKLFSSKKEEPKAIGNGPEETPEERMRRRQAANMMMSLESERYRKNKRLD